MNSKWLPSGSGMLSSEHFSMSRAFPVLFLLYYSTSRFRVVKSDLKRWPLLCKKLLENFEIFGNRHQNTTLVIASVAEVALVCDIQGYNCQILQTHLNCSF